MSAKKEMVGMTCGMLTVVEDAGRNADGKSVWRCRCQCGQETVVRGTALRRGKTKSCGCLKNAERGAMDLAGQRFTRLVVVCRAGAHMRNGVPWLCRCDCGNELVVPSGRLRSGNTKSCGCIKVERIGALRRTHGASRTPEYVSWCGMKGRCYNENDQDYAEYGGRGIIVCKRWRESFKNFLADMGPKPFARATIDRKNVNGNYEPRNCRWATQQEQTRNKRTNRFIEHAGDRLTVAEWAERTGIHRSVLEGRLARGWPLDEALSPDRKTKWSRRKPNR